MASLANNISLLTPQTAADVRARIAQVRVWRDRVWPSQRPWLAAPPQPVPAPDASNALETLPPALIDAVAGMSPAADNDNMALVPGRITVRHVVEVAAQHFKTTAEALQSHCRAQPITRQRQVAAFVARQTTARSLPFIGKKMGGRDHSTILHAVRTVQARIDAGDADTIAAVDAIVARIQTTGGANV
jgi:hypothetical protein